MEEVLRAIRLWKQNSWVRSSETISAQRRTRIQNEPIETKRITGQQGSWDRYSEGKLRKTVDWSRLTAVADWQS